MKEQPQPDRKHLPFFNMRGVEPVIEHYKNAKVYHCPVCGNRPTIQPDYGPLCHIYCSVYACNFPIIVTAEGVLTAAKAWNKAVKKYQKQKEGDEK